MRVLYWDIDGTINDYADLTKPCMSAGALEKALKNKCFDHLVCVSGWSSIVLEQPWARRTSL